ncbi:glycerophosphodiester phosphodiesterase [Alsobacter sp. R-9]
MNRWLLPWDDIKRTLVIAHRGASALAPENSTESFRAALTAGADAIETDVRLTRDGVVVCFHDSTLARLAAGDPRRVEDIDYRELKAILPAVVTLREAAVASRNCGLLLDVKLTPDQPIEPVITIVKRDRARDRYLIGLRHPVHAAAVRLAGLPILAFSSAPDDMRAWFTAGATWFRLWQVDVTLARATDLRGWGMRMAVMAGDPYATPPVVGVSAAEDWTALAVHRPDAVIVDDPRSYI